MAQVFLKCLEWKEEKESNDACENIDEFVFFCFLFLKKGSIKEESEMNLFFQLQ